MTDFLWRVGVMSAVFLAALLVGQGLFLAADWRERRRTGAPLTPERGERVGVRVGAVFGVLVFVVMIFWAGVAWKVLSAAAVAVSVYLGCHAGIAGGVKARAAREKMREQRRGLKPRPPETM